VPDTEDDAIAIDRRAERPLADAPLPETGANGRAGGKRLHPQLRALTAGAPPSERRIRNFLARNRFPLVERDAVTFVFQGEADAIYLHHFMRGIPGGLPFEQIPGTNLWHLRLSVPRGSRFEYKFDVVRNGQGGWINDPLNPAHATDPYGANSEGRSYGYSPPIWSEPNAEIPSGRIELLSAESRAFGESREFGVYLPPGFAEDRSYPLLILHDGKDFVDHAGLTTALDGLIHQGEAPSLIAVLTRPGERNGEYTGDPRHADFLTEDVLPLVRQRFAVRPEPDACVLMGSSLGAVASVATTFRHPGVYGALALMSGSFIFDRALLETRDPLFERVADFVDHVRSDPARLPRRAFVSCGLYEGLIGQNRILARFLAEHGVEVRFVETRDGHHWRNWRDQLQAALSWTLPGEA
jgi:enterochelin esterase family protein